MLWLSVVVLERDARSVLRAMGELGTIHLSAEPAGPDTAPLRARDRSADLARCEGLLSRAEALRRSLGLADGTQESPALVEMPLLEADTTLQVLEQQASSMLQQQQNLVDRCAQTSAAHERLAAYSDVDLPLDQLDHCAFLHFAIGSVPAQHVQRLHAAVDPTVVLLPLSTRQGRRSVIAVGSSRGRADLQKTLQDLDFAQESLPATGGTISALLEKSRADTQRTRAEADRVNAALEAFTINAAAALSQIAESAATEKCLLQMEQCFPRTGAAVLVNGWASTTSTPVILGRVREITGGRCVTEIVRPDGQFDERVPVLLEQCRLLRPFAMLVKGYGLPRYGELTPTLLVAISYLVMFGMMFGDVGHGAVLLAAGIAWHLASRNPVSRDMALLLALAGLASAAFGLVYGSYFGIAGLRRFALWRDPLEGDPLELMYAAMGVGVVVISAGLVLNIINHARRGDLAVVFLDRFGIAGILFYWGGLLLLTQYAVLHRDGLVPVALLAFVAVPVVAWMVRHVLACGSHRHAGSSEGDEGWLTVIAESMVEAFEGVLVYLANTVSFVRLAAYAMSHAALLMAAFLVAGMVQRGTALGEFLGLLIIILGNVVAIILEGVIASVQTVRLEYYEFFSKFFSGAGRPFTPFCLTAKGDRP